VIHRARKSEAVKSVSSTNKKSGCCAVLALLIAITLIAIPASKVMAAPPGGDLASKSQQAAEITNQINAMDKDLEIATEAYDRVKEELDNISQKVDETRQRLFDVRESLKQRQSLLNARAVTMYKNGRTSMLEVLLRTKDFGDFLQRADYVARITENDAGLVRKIKSTRDAVTVVERQLSEQQRQQEGLVQQAAAKKNQVETGLAQRQALLNSINQDIQNLLAQETQRKAQEASALEKQAQQQLSNAPNAPSSDIANTAMKYLGIPYHLGGGGPGTCPTGEHRICFDCSGLTKYVYMLFGIDLPHNAAMQYDCGIKIPLSQAQPGDLVFFGSPAHHVGMYLGNDLFIQAPHTGDVVKVSKLSDRSDISGVCRYTKG
jgi:cell wall-associated NlpC family hydrolase